MLIGAGQEVRCTVVDADRNGIGHCFFRGDAKTDDAGFGVKGFLLVEDEVADAVEDGLATVSFCGLKGVGVVTDDDVSTGINQRMSLQPLLGQRTQRMLGAPMQINDDNCDGIGLFDDFYPVEKGVERLLADTLAIGQVGETLQRKAIRGEEINGARP